MNIDKQKLILEYYSTNGDVFSRTNNIVESAYFDPELKKAIDFTKSYYESYKALPNPEQIQIETGVKVTPREVLRSEMEYAIDEIGIFCKREAIKKAVFAAPQLLQEGNFGEIEKIIKDAVLVGVTDNIGLNYFEDPEERLKRMLTTQASIPTKISLLDEYLNGGFNRKEMTLFMANSGRGKSLFMANCAVNFIEQGLNVVYITLELSEDVVAKRFDSMITGISQDQIFKKIAKVSNDIQVNSKNLGRLTIKRLPETTTNANDIRAYLKEYEMLNEHTPDVIFIDYLDLMASNNKISAENMFVKDKFVAEEVRSIANDFNMVVVSACQQGRDAINSDTADIGQHNIQGGISKVNTCDNLVSIIQSDAMKSANEYILKLVKTRSSAGVGKTVPLSFDPISLRVFGSDEKPSIKVKYEKPETEDDNRRANLSPESPDSGSNEEKLLNLFNV